MSPVRRMLVIPVVAFVALVGIAISATPAQAAPPDPPCEWEPGQWGTHSGCDGLDPSPTERHFNYCNFAALPYWADRVDVVGPSGIILAEVALIYTRGRQTELYPDGACRTIDAGIRVLNGAATDCYVKIERNSDKLAYRVGGEYQEWQETPVVYDAGVTSYAWGYCKFGGLEYSARTRNY